LYLDKEMGVNHKKVQRVYGELGLTVKRTRRKHLRRTLHPRPGLTAPNQEWALDFASDVTAAGQRFRVRGVIDSFTRQCLALGRYRLSQPARYARARTGDRSTRKAAIDPQ
jgi:putative transposase